jgi:hypothetical protein
MLTSNHFSQVIWIVWGLSATAAATTTTTRLGYFLALVFKQHKRLVLELKKILPRDLMPNFRPCVKIG